MNPPAQPAPRPSFRNRGEVASPRNGARGITLIELLVVLVILAAVAGIVTLTISSGISVRGTDGVSRDAAEIATMATMRTVREALVGGSVAEPGYLQDVGKLPSGLAGLMIKEDGVPLYDPVTKRGWRGPYLQDGGARYGDRIESGDGFPTSPPAILDDPAILDGWGKPLILIVETRVEDGSVVDYSRLVSAGPPSAPGERPTLDSPSTMPTPASNFDRGNDLVQFLFIADPSL